MQNTTHYNLKKPDYTDFADIQDINDNMDTIDEKLAAPDGDGRDQVVSFTNADLDSGITSFPSFLTKIVSGMKLAKFIRDFKAGMAYVLHVGDLINNATCTESGKALDARMGKTLQDQITSLNDSLANVGKHWFHITVSNLPSGYKGVQVVFTADGINPVLIADADNNILVITQNWLNVTALTQVTPRWISNIGTISTVYIGLSSDNKYRIKLLYTASPVAAAVFSLDGRCIFERQEFTQT